MPYVITSCAPTMAPASRSARSPASIPSPGAAVLHRSRSVHRLRAVRDRLPGGRDLQGCRHPRRARGYHRGQRQLLPQEQGRRRTGLRGHGMGDGARGPRLRESVGFAVTVAVVDEAGFPIAVGRMDGADPRTAELAVRKAYTAAAFHLATSDLAAQARQPWLKSLPVAHRGRLLPAGGGIAIIDGIVIIGGVGVAGASRPTRTSSAAALPSPYSKAPATEPCSD